jgi:hypothetical protein
MPLLDLSLATQTLSNLLDRRVKNGLTALGQPAPVINGLKISGLPADTLTGDQTIGIFLYHVTEEAQFKNPPPVSRDKPQVRFRPMGLNLYYQLSAHSDLLGDQSAPRTQMLFGLALKAMHDFPCIDTSTILNGAPVFPAALQGTDNVFRVTLQTIQPNDAPNYWTGGSQRLGLAAYYIVSTALLEPEPPTVFAGRVLRYGVHTFVRGAARLDASRSTVTFRVPGETMDRDVEVQPAEAPVGAEIRCHGTDLAGDETTLLLKNARFTEPVEVGSTWGVIASEDQITATVSATTGTFDTLPGTYSAMAKVVMRRRMPDGSFRSFPQTSNEVPFLVTPAVTNPPVNTVATANAQGVVIITGGIFDHPDIPADAVSVMVGPQNVPREPTAALTPGHFRVSSPTQLRFRFPIAGLNSGEVLPFRIVVNGAENAPRWVAVP